MPSYLGKTIKALKIKELIGGGGGNRTRYQGFLVFYEMLSKTMKNHVISGL
ncbi:TPA: hypothetical protein ACUU34_002937 [Legionella pneumophila]|nr:hypothetical protein [Legionella pneumophila]